MRPVDFFIVGQPKSGTTALATFLDEHPEIAVSVPKEPGYMASDLREESLRVHGDLRKIQVPDQRAYEECFESAADGQLTGDASTWYLFSRNAATDIKAHNPDARIVVMLREPISMLASLHRQYVNETVEDITDLTEAVAAEEDRKAGRRVPSRAPVPSLLHYRDRVRFREQIERYHAAFGKDAVLVALNSDLRSDADRLYGDILAHIGVADTAFRPDFRGVHESKSARSPLLNRIARSDVVKVPVRKLLGQRRYTELQKKVVEPALMTAADRIQVDPELEAALKSELVDEVRYVSELTGRDLVTEWGY
ncbi:sulfotransferase [Demequina soli]|uniref:sulfotransferase n=1 Tax=Demequina soli TaxID=1638987 RepID=UPI000783F739|nr:sulfotransferase [Demequina soli]